MKLPHHLFTGDGAIDFGTVAISTCVPPDVRALFTERAQSYPLESQWGRDGAPLVIRGYPVPRPDGPSDHAVSRLMATGRTLDGRLGNYLAHTYWVPAALLEEQGRNLPWIALHLPTGVDGRLVRAGRSRVHELDPYELAVACEGQMALCADAMRELSWSAMRALVEHLVDRACGAAPSAGLDVDMPDVPPETVTAYSRGSGPEPPSPDAVRLLRLAGALAVLPPAFKADCAFAVNDIGSLARCVRVRRDAGVMTPASGEWPWFDHVARLALENRLDELTAMTLWLGRLLPTGCRPSRTALDRAHALYVALVAPPSAADTTLPDVARHVAALRGCDVEVAVLYEAVHPYLARRDGREADRLEILAVLAGVASRVDRPLPRSLLDDIVRVLAAEPGRADAARRSFLLGLPCTVQGLIWRRAFEIGSAPASVPGAPGRPDAAHLAFTLATLDPSTLPGPEPRDRIVAHLVGCLGAASDDGSLPSAGVTTHPGVRALAALTRVDVCQRALVSLLVERLVRDLLEMDVAPGWRLSDHHAPPVPAIVADLLTGCGTVGPLVLAEFTRLAARCRPHEAVRAVFAAPLDVDMRRRSVEFLASLDRVWRDVEASRLIAVQVELAAVLDEAEGPTGPADAVDRLVWFGIWKETWRSGWRRSDEDQRAAFWGRLVTTLHRVPSVVALPVGALYALAGGDERRGVLRVVLDRVYADPQAVALWAASGPPVALRARMACLANLILAASVRGKDALGAALGATDRVLALMTPQRERQEAAMLIGTALESARAPRWLRTRYTAGWRRPQ